MDRSKFLLCSALALALSLACSMTTPAAGPSAGSTEAPAPIAQNSPAPQPQEQLPTDAPPPTEAPPPTVEAPMFYTEEFSEDSGLWVPRLEKNADEGDLSQAKVTIEDGRLNFDLGKWLIAYMFYEPHEYKDVRLDVRVENRGTNVNNILLICRSSDEGLYLVNVANSGLFAMYALDGATGVYTRIADGGSNKILAGKEINEYSLVCHERTLTLYINGIETRSYTDNRFVLRDGQVGVGVASEDQLPVKLEFDWVKISEK